MKTKLYRFAFWIIAATLFLLSMAPKRWGNQGP